MKPDGESCKSCRFWDNANGEVGYCHRRSPGLNSQGHSSWPMVSCYQWCGDFALPTPPQDREAGK